LHAFALAAQQQPTFVFNERSLDSLLHRSYDDSLPGISIAILSQEKTVFKRGYGVSNISTRANLTDSSNFNICSLTKQFTAVAVLQLEEKHLLSLNDKLSRFFPAMNKRSRTSSPYNNCSVTHPVFPTITALPTQPT
jgi:CubicO group peptidase (beta-lactamase class C family)